MEAKKNPQHDVHRLTSRNFLIGLSVSVSLAIIAFEWTTEKIEGNIVVENEAPLESLMAVMTPLKSEPLPAQLVERKSKPIIIPTVVETSAEENFNKKNIDIDFSDDASDSRNEGAFYSDVIPEDSTSIIVFAEIHPKPVGGYENFYTQIGKLLKYPRQASRYEIQGKVFVEFVVDRQGKVSQMKVVKGIGSGCDEEAMRVLASTTWEPGKQRGKPVNVRMVMPITFRLQ